MQVNNAGIGGVKFDSDGGVSILWMDLSLKQNTGGLEIHIYICTFGKKFNLQQLQVSCAVCFHF